MAEGQIRVGVVGLGAFGSHHARHYAAHPGAVLVAVADADSSRAEAAAGAYGAAAASSHRDLIGKVDAVSVAVPASLHHTVAGDLVDAGIHILVEKPIATDSAAARDLIARAARTGAVLQVGHIERFSPITGVLRERVAAPRRIACVRHAKPNARNGDVDVVLDLMIHDIDLVLTLAKTPPVSVSASGRASAGGRIDEAEAWLTFADGLAATLSASRVAGESLRRISVTEPDAAYVADLGAGRLTVADRSRWGAEASTIDVPAHDNLAAEIDAFLAAVSGRTAPVVDGAAGLAALEVAERIQAAIADADIPMRREVAR